MTNIIRCKRCGMRRLAAIERCPECGYTPLNWSTVAMFALFVLYLICVSRILKELLR